MHYGKRHIVEANPSASCGLSTAHANSIQMVDLRIDCPFCGVSTLIPNVPVAALRDWQNGTPIQRVFPRLSVGYREALISGLCSSCFEKATVEEARDAEASSEVPPGELPLPPEEGGPNEH